MKRLLALVLCLAAADAAGAQTLDEDFESGTWPPSGWTVVDNMSAGTSWNVTSAYLGGAALGAGNVVPGGAGECAAIDSDFYGSVDIDGELWTPPFDVPANGLALLFDHDFYYWAWWNNEIADIDVSTDGGVTWVNELRYTGANFFGPDHLDLTAYAGMTGILVRFRYYDARFDYWWQVDNVRSGAVPTPAVCAYWHEDFDGGTWPPSGWSVVDHNTFFMPWNISSAFPRGNMTPGGMGYCAAVDSDWYGDFPLDTELRSAPFDIPREGITLLWNHEFDWFAGGLDEKGDVDISIDDGVTWTNLASFSGADFAGEESVDLTAYAGAVDVLVRFRYHDAQHEWWWHVDDVRCVQGASAVVRNGGANPLAYSVSGPPIQHQTFTASIDTAMSNHGFAQLFGYQGTMSMSFPGGQTILMDFSHPGGELLQLPVIAGSPATYDLAVPGDCAFTGLEISTQAATFNLPPTTPWKLTNAVDLVIGY